MARDVIALVKRVLTGGKIAQDIDSSRRKWLGRYSSIYSLISMAGAGSAALSSLAISLSFVIEAWVPFRGYFAVAAALSGLLAWLYRNADDYEARQVEKADMDGLIQALSNSLTRLHEAAKADPESSEARRYVESVIESLRMRLEPEGSDNHVRICIYRRDEGEHAEAQDGAQSGIEAGDTSSAVTVFSKYVFVRGGRRDFPRKQFRDDEEPGCSFMPELFSRGRYARSHPANFATDNGSHPGDKETAYKSFVNLTVEDENGLPLAMLTCDSKEPYFFNERRERLIRAFRQLVHLAIASGATTTKRPVRPGPRDRRAGGSGFSRSVDMGDSFRTAERGDRHLATSEKVDAVNGSKTEQMLSERHKRPLLSEPEERRILANREENLRRREANERLDRESYGRLGGRYRT